MRLRGSTVLAVDARYSRWDGTQDPLRERADIGDLLERLSHDLLHGFGGREALSRALRDGVGGARGIDELRAQLAARREELRQQVDPDGVLAAWAERLEAVIDEEREALAGMDDDAARLGELDLDTMPSDLGGRLRALQQHEFASGRAKEMLDELLDELRKDVLDGFIRGMTGAMESVTPEALARVTAMLADLNELLAKRSAGSDTTEDFSDFMARHGELFPEQPADLDELLAVLAARARAMSELLAAMTPEQRAQLRELADAAFGDLDLQFQLSQLGEQLGQLAQQVPGIFGDGGAPQPGDGSGMPFSEAVNGMQRLGELDDLDAALDGDRPGATLDDVDLESLGRALGEDAVRDVRRLREIERTLEESGMLKRRDGELELTARGARMLGNRHLVQLYDRIRREPSTTTRGAEPEPTGATRPWQFGDREPLAVTATVRNAVMRGVGSGWRPGEGMVPLAAQDFEVVETEVRPRTATALLLDLSFSMPLQGHFVPAKRMVLALSALIAGRHRQDSLHLIGFSDYARRMRPEDLGAVGFERVYGTNMHHAFLLARRVLADDPRPVKQVIMVTDGEPTAHLEDGQAWFNYPPIPETLEATLREAMRLARSGIALNIFLLEDAPGLVAFAQKLAGLTDGQVFRMSAEDLGEAIVGGYEDLSRGGRSA